MGLGWIARLLKCIALSVMVIENFTAAGNNTVIKIQTFVCIFHIGPADLLRVSTS